MTSRAAPVWACLALLAVGSACEDSGTEELSLPSEPDLGRPDAAAAATLDLGVEADGGLVDGGRPTNPPPSYDVRIASLVYRVDRATLPPPHDEQDLLTGLEFRLDPTYIDFIDRGGVALSMPFQASRLGVRWTVMLQTATTAAGVRFDERFGGRGEIRSPLVNGVGAVLSIDQLDLDRDPTSELWIAGRARGQVRFDGHADRYFVEMVLEPRPDSTRPTLQPYAANALRHVPFERHTFEASEPVYGTLDSAFLVERLDGRDLPEGMRGTRLEWFADGYVRLEIQSRSWPVEGYRILYRGGLRDHMGFEAPPRVLAEVGPSMARPRTIVDFEEAPELRPVNVWRGEQWTNAEVCRGNGCAAIQPYPTFVARGLYAQVQSNEAFNQVSLDYRVIAAECETSVFGCLTMAGHALGGAPGSHHSACAYADPSPSAPQGFACDSGWQEKVIPLPQATTQAGVVVEVVDLSGFDGKWLIVDNIRPAP